ncbi:MAG: hypothetical protein COU33_04245 [Candidatus Magasanikbacteria bacterium CG10_big_fil_rev_8_21_14_0_10_43_6]|uniref:Uncharacterized protein n=1 Tax=Candidatus Magasanikbacteria bacterium CG10_big_fil_rev_8_21_14_0_10_43_6 TaxID=1974650 RepID=A0A2M6W0E2_9BACT|nr:MAG: hypothetical protein COU33_04245 [Candidatus Magasanikbacteria bacterium CG10_big_fil_rev_8_21_14_0_10_43_6]
MIAIPLYVILFLYFLFLAVIATFVLINLYHIVATASFTLVSFTMTFFIFAGITLVLYYTAQLLHHAAIDWKTPLVLFNVDWFRTIFGSQPF